MGNWIDPVAAESVATQKLLHRTLQNYQDSSVRCDAAGMAVRAQVSFGLHNKVEKHTVPTLLTAPLGKRRTYAGANRPNTRVADPVYGCRKLA